MDSRSLLNIITCIFLAFTSLLFSARKNGHNRKFGLMLKADCEECVGTIYFWQLEINQKKFRNFVLRKQRQNKNRFMWVLWFEKSRQDIKWLLYELENTNLLHGVNKLGGKRFRDNREIRFNFTTKDGKSPPGVTCPRAQLAPRTPPVIEPLNLNFVSPNGTQVQFLGYDLIDYNHQIITTKFRPK